MCKDIEMENADETTRRKLPGRDVLDLFNIVAESDDAGRIKATKRLLEHLQRQQASNDKGLCGDVKYAINRLVQGLSSDRKFARIGYSTALCQLLRTVNSVASSDVLTCIQENTKSQHSANATKTEERSVLLGQAFGLLTLINSGRIFSEKSGEIVDIVEKLLQLYNKKTYLQALCLNGILQIVTQVSHEVFKKSVLPHIEKQFTTGWDDSSPDTLQLLLTSHKHHPAAVKKYLKDHWSGDQLISEKNFPHLGTVVRKSAGLSHVTHPVVDELLATIQEKHLDIGKFWKQVGINLLSPEKRVRVRHKQILGLHILEKILPLIDTTKKLKEVMLPNIGSVFIQLCSKKMEEGTKGAKKTYDIINKIHEVLKDLVKLTSASKDPQFQLEMLKCLISPPGSFEFDNQTHTSTVAQILCQLLPEAKNEYIEELMKAFRGEPSWLAPENQTASLPQWCVKQLCLMCVHAESSWQLMIFQFLFLHSFFTVKKYKKDIPHCNLIAREVTEFQRKFVADSFFRTVTKLLSKHDKGTIAVSGMRSEHSEILQFSDLSESIPKATNLNQHIDLLFELSNYVQQLLQVGDCVQLLKPDHQSEIKEEWNKLSGVISTINKKRNPDEILDGHAFELLFIYFGLQLFDDPENLQESLLDLYVCHKKSTNRRKSLAKDDGPAWIDVITELLLSMMFKENASSRFVAKQAMSFLADHVTTSTVQLIVDALEQTSLDSEEGMVGVEDDDDDDDDDDENDKTQIDDNDVDINGSSSDDDDDDEDSDDSGIEEETDLVVPDKLKEKLKVALGDAAGNLDEEDDNEDDDDKDVEFSDSEMFKLDSVLASAFRSMSKSKKMEKQKSRQLLQFKTRVLDLVEVILKSQLSPVIAKGLILPLFNLVERGLRRNDEETLGNKAENILQLLLKQKKVKPGDEVDKDELLEMLEYLMKCSNKVPVPSFIQITGNACLYVLKLLLQESGVSPLKTRSKAGNKQKKTTFYKEKVEAMMSSALLELLGHKPGHCQPAFFHMLIVKFPLIFWSSYKDLINTVQSQDAKAFDRTQAAAFLANMVSKDLFDEIQSEDWSQFVKSWKSVATLVINEMASEKKFKKNLLEEVVATCNQIKQVSPNEMILDEEVQVKLLEMQSRCDKSIKKSINKLTKGMDRSGIKKRKKEKSNEIDWSSAAKKMNKQNQSEVIDDESTENQSSEKEGKLRSKKKKSRKSENKSEENNAEILNQSLTNGDDISKGQIIKSFDSINESDNTKEQVHGISTPMSQKKKKKQKSIEHVNKEAMEEENVEPVLSPGREKKMKLRNEGNQSTTNDSVLDESIDISKSAKKRKRKSVRSKVNDSSVLEESMDVSESGKKVEKSMNSTASDSSVLEEPFDVSASGKKKRKKSMNTV